MQAGVPLLPKLMCWKRMGSGPASPGRAPFWGYRHVHILAVWDFRHFARENRMARQVIQIAADTGQIYALCDDGEIFRFSGETWHPVSPIPQGDPRDAAKPKQKIGFVDDEPGG
jgi:hypothetical protein